MLLGTRLWGGRRSDPLAALRDRIRAATGDPAAEVVEYLQVKRAQYLDTDFIPRASTRWSAEIMWQPDSDGNYSLFGVRKAVHDAECERILFQRPGNNNQFRFGNGPLTWSNTGANPTTLRHVEKFDGRKWFYDGDNYINVSYSGFGSLNTPLRIFARRYEGSADIESYFKGLCYTLVFRDDNASGLNFVPVLIGGAYSMYDLVSDTLFVNQGSGAFSGGPVVTDIAQLTPAQKAAWGLAASI